MSKYGYISLDMLYEYTMNTIDKTVSPNDFMRMPRANVIPIEWIEQWSFQNQSMNYGNGRNCILKLLKDWEDENVQA